MLWFSGSFFKSRKTNCGIFKGEMEVFLNFLQNPAFFDHFTHLSVTLEKCETNSSALKGKCSHPLSSVVSK